MLNELERGVETLFDMVPSFDSEGMDYSDDVSSADELRKQWETRLSFVQVELSQFVCS